MSVSVSQNVEVGPFPKMARGSLWLAFHHQEAVCIPFLRNPKPSCVILEPSCNAPDHLVARRDLLQAPGVAGTGYNDHRAAQVESVLKQIETAASRHLKSSLVLFWGMWPRTSGAAS